MPYTMNTNFKCTSYLDSELGAPILDHLLQGHTVVLDNDFVPESYIENLFETIRDNLLKLVKRGEITYERVQNALTNLITKSSLEELNLPKATPTVIVRMQMLASIEEC